MAEHAHITPTTGRRRLGAGLLAIVAGSGITAGAAASVADLVPAEQDPDAPLLALRAELLAAVTEFGWSEMIVDISDQKLTEVADRLRNVCWQIVEAPRAQTAAGRALKAAGAMYRFRDGFDHGAWPGDGEAMAWDVLSELAGEVYVPPAMPERLRAMCEPGRA